MHFSFTIIYTEGNNWRKKDATMKKILYEYASVIQVLLWLGVQCVPNLVVKDPKQPNLPENQRYVKILYTILQKLQKRSDHFILDIG